ncbi:DUF1572 domain-containing protein [Fulvivirga kasyanovii]|uniref:DUF1572 domain-containing protein n=1 Tax=Fulvivirga kasyanovii TaxID=396812 RepID=A0ABW9RWD8_9BACT|nr:DUF1572 family protein [Fulvivirga kasyanovii]MTI28569.1 DUF1572 domain-containing protein [Fulvivirga kasyanovii]
MKGTYLESIIKQFEYYKLLGEKTFAQLTGEQLMWEYTQDCNSIATIVKHLWGNMLSRWTDFLTEDGEKTWRDRDAEFENDIADRQELMDKWNEGWKCLFEALKPLSDHDLEREIFIRNQGHTVVEAINRQLAHYAYHVGQIVYIGKIAKKDSWQTLSIAKGQSKQFNAQKFAEEKHRQHFTDEFLKGKE